MADEALEGAKDREIGGFHDDRDRRNPPILHRKETFLHPEPPLCTKFARLTRIEETKGLYAPRIGARDGWNAALAQKGLHLRGHRLVRANSGA